MASKRRGGFRPPELRGTLGTLIRTTTGVVRDAIERGAREGRARLDDARTGRRRHDTLADLGELVLDLIRRGEIDLAELPEARDLVRQLDALDAEADEEDAEPEPEPPRASLRRRFDDRPPRQRRAGDDGTVSSGLADRATRPTAQDRPREASSTRAPTRPMKGLWRPMIDDAPPMPERGERGDRPMRPDRADRATRPDPVERPTDPAERLARPDHRSRPVTRNPSRPGGISFDDDDDLADYMHPDDVPPKPPAKDPGDHDA